MRNLGTNILLRRARRAVALFARTTAAAAAVAVAVLPGQLSAAPIIDAPGDFLLTYTGPLNPGLDVIAHETTLTADRLIFYGKMSGDIASTASIGGVYITGLDRGQGTARFLVAPNAPPVIGPNVVWDSVVRIAPNGTGSFVNIIAGVTTPLDPLDIVITGNEYTASLPLSLFALGATRPADQWTYNLWPRNGQGLNVQVSDLGPDDGNSPVHSVPEPGTVALAAIGAGALRLRRRRR